MAAGRRAEAAKQFEASLTMAPDHVEPLAQLVQIALAERRPDDALGRVKKQMALAPNSAGLQHLLGLVHLARREGDAAEAAFLKAIELEPRLTDPYVQLQATAQMSKERFRAPL